MKGHISIEIPTKKYIKAYIYSELGPEPVITPSNRIGNKLYDLLQHRVNDRRTEFATVYYDDTIKLYVNIREFRIRGGFLTETSIKNFNLFVEDEIKHRYRTMMDFYTEVFPNFKENLKHVRRHIGICDESWDDQSIQKDYYRYRKRTGKALFYNVNNSQAS